MTDAKVRHRLEDRLAAPPGPHRRGLLAGGPRWGGRDTGRGHEDRVAAGRGADAGSRRPRPRREPAAGAGQEGGGRGRRPLAPHRPPAAQQDRPRRAADGTDPFDRQRTRPGSRRSFRPQAWRSRPHTVGSELQPGGEQGRLPSRGGARPRRPPDRVGGDAGRGPHDDGGLRRRPRGVPAGVRRTAARCGTCCGRGRACRCRTCRWA